MLLGESSNDTLYHLKETRNFKTHPLNVLLKFVFQRESKNMTLLHVRKRFVVLCLFKQMETTSSTFFNNAEEIRNINCDISN